MSNRTRGRPRIHPLPVTPTKPEKAPLKTVSDLVGMMEAYRAQSNGRNRGMFEDCKSDIYKLFAVDYSDKQVAEIRATPMTDKVYQEWERKFSRAFKVAA